MAAILLNSTILTIALLLAGAQRVAQSPAPPLALVGARVYASPADAPLDDAVVLIEGARITSVGARQNLKVPEGVTTLDCKGLVVVAGFQNSHVHFSDSRWESAPSQPADRLAGHLEAMLTRYGFTTVVDTGSDLANTVALRRRIDSGEVPGPRILTAGFGLFPPDGVPYYVRDIVPPELLRLAPQPRTPREAQSIVDRQLTARGDIVKLFTGSWVERGTVKPMPADVAAAAVKEAHARRRLVFSHPSNVAGFEVALRAGVDVLAHPIEDTRGFSREHLARMKRDGMGLVPTLHLFRGLPDALDQVRNLVRLGGDVLFGTDVGYLPDFDHGEEYDLMAAAGLGWREILASLTTVPARRFREASERGQVAPGMAADLVVLSADPLFGVRAFSKVRYTIRNGRVIFTAPAEQLTDAIAELKDMQQRILRALLAHNRDEYAAMLAPEWRVTYADGRVRTRSEVLDDVFGRPEPLLRGATIAVADVLVMGDLAVVTGRTEAIPQRGDSVRLRFVDVVNRRNDRWMVTASFATFTP